MWPLRKFASKFAKAQHAELARSVNTGLDLAAVAVAQARWAGPRDELLNHSTVPGHRYLRVRSAARPYVIFSDHHIAYDAAAFGTSARTCASMAKSWTSTP